MNLQPMFLSEDIRGLTQYGIATPTWKEATMPVFKTAKRGHIPHANMLELSFKNIPFKGAIEPIIFTDSKKASSSFIASLPALKEMLFETHFSVLEEIGITFDSSSSEIEKALSGMQGDVSLCNYREVVAISLKTFSHLFVFIEKIAKINKLEEKHLMHFFSICKAFTTIASSSHENASRLMKPLGILIDYNQARHIFEIPLVLPNQSLVEIAMAMPVCYFPDLGNDETAKDPQVTEDTKYLCDMVGSKNFAWLFQIYNRRERSLKNFPKFDPIPLEYLEVQKLMKPFVKLDVIFTPYHDQASTEWADSSWLKGIDPVAISAIENCPYFIVTKRWSGNGIFPSFSHLVASTIEHLKKNKNLLVDDT